MWVATSVFFSSTVRRIIGSTSGSSAFTGDSPRESSGIFQKLRGLGRWQPMTNLPGWPSGPVESATIAAITAPTKPTPMTTTISLPSARAAATRDSIRASSRSSSSGVGSGNRSPAGETE